MLTLLIQDDLMGLDFSKGDCRNASVPQNVTFGYQVRGVSVHVCMRSNCRCM